MDFTNMRTINDYPALKAFMWEAPLEVVLQGVKILLEEMHFTPEEMEASFPHAHNGDDPELLIGTEFLIEYHDPGVYIDKGEYLLWIGVGVIQYYKANKWRNTITTETRWKEVKI